MTTAVSPSVDWIRLAIGDDEIVLSPSPGIEVRLQVAPVSDDGYLEPLTRDPAPRTQFTVDLVLTDTAAATHCEVEARRVVEALGGSLPATAPLREFSLEAALSGEGLPYNRVLAPRLALSAGVPHELDEDDQEAGVRVFTAIARADDLGHVYQMQLVD